jgi:hypothetical protein
MCAESRTIKARGGRGGSDRKIKAVREEKRKYWRVVACGNGSKGGGWFLDQ